MHRLVRRAVVVISAAALTLSLTALLPETARAAAPGWKDTTYGTGGVTALAGDGSTAIRDDGTILRASVDQTTNAVTLATIDPAGRASSRVVLTLPALESLEGVAALPDGSALIQGYRQRTDTDGGPTLRRVNPDGTVDAAFGTGGRVLLATLDSSRFGRHTTVTLPDGRFLLISSGELGSRVARYTADGRPDPSWGLGAPLTLAGRVDDAAALGDDLVLVTADEAGASSVVRLDAAGGRVAGFGTAGVETLAAVTGLTPLHATRVTVAGDRILIAVSQILPGNRGRTGVVRLLPTGGLDADFGAGGIAWAPITTGPDPQAPDVRGCYQDARALTAGTGLLLVTAGDGCSAGTLVLTRFSAAGGLDRGFGSGGSLVVSELGGVRPAWRGSVVAAAVAGGKFVVGAARKVGFTEGDGPDSFASFRLADAAPDVPGGFVPLEPSRVLDTRSGLGAPAGKVAANGQLTLALAGRGSLPASGVGAVLMNVTVTSPTAACAITVAPSDGAVPTASNLNCVAGETRANLVSVRLGSDGAVKFRNGSNGTSHLVADVVGYYRAGTAVDAGAFRATAPVRVLDSRTGTGVAKGRVATGRIVSLKIAGVAGVPATGVASVVLNTTAVAPGGAGYLTAWPGGTPRPVASNLNFEKGRTVANLATVKVGADGTVSLLHTAPGGADLVADLSGYYLAGTPTRPGTFVSLTPTRVADTRSSSIVGPAQGVLVPVLGRAGIPATGVAAVSLNATITGVTGSTNLTVRDADAPSPITTSTVNGVRGATVAGAAVTSAGSLGVQGWNSGPGRTHVVIDVGGWFRE